MIGHEPGVKLCTTSICISGSNFFEWALLHERELVLTLRDDTNKSKPQELVQDAAESARKPDIGYATGMNTTRVWSIAAKVNNLGIAKVEYRYALRKGG